MSRQRSRLVVPTAKEVPLPCFTRDTTLMEQLLYANQQAAIDNPRLTDPPGTQYEDRHGRIVTLLWTQGPLALVAKEDFAATVVLTGALTFQPHPLYEAKSAAWLKQACHAIVNVSSPYSSPHLEVLRRVVQAIDPSLAKSCARRMVEVLVDFCIHAPDRNHTAKLCRAVALFTDEEVDAFYRGDIDPLAEMVKAGHVSTLTVPAPTVPAPTVPAPTVPAPTVPAPTVPAPTVPAPTVPAPTVSAPKKRRAGPSGPAKSKQRRSDKRQPEPAAVETEQVAVPVAVLAPKKRRVSQVGLAKNKKRRSGSRQHNPAAVEPEPVSVPAVVVPLAVAVPVAAEPESEPVVYEPRPAEPEPAEPESAEPEPAEPEPAEPESAGPRPAEPEPVEPEPVEPEPTGPKPAEPEPTGPKPAEPEPAEPKPTGPKPVEPTETKPVEPEAMAVEPVKTKPTGPEAAEAAEPAEPKPVDPEAAAVEPVKTRLVVANPVAAGPALAALATQAGLVAAIQSTHWIDAVVALIAADLALSFLTDDLIDELRFKLSDPSCAAQLSDLADLRPLIAHKRLGQSVARVAREHALRTVSVGALRPHSYVNLVAVADAAGDTAGRAALQCVWAAELLQRVSPETVGSTLVLLSREKTESLERAVVDRLEEERDDPRRLAKVPSLLSVLFLAVSSPAVCTVLVDIEVARVHGGHATYPMTQVRDKVVELRRLARRRDDSTEANLPFEALIERCTVPSLSDVSVAATADELSRAIQLHKHSNQPMTWSRLSWVLAHPQFVRIDGDKYRWPDDSLARLCRDVVDGDAGLAHTEAQIHSLIEAGTPEALALACRSLVWIDRPTLLPSLLKHPPQAFPEAAHVWLDALARRAQKHSF